MKTFICILSILLLSMNAQSATWALRVSLPQTNVIDKGPARSSSEQFRIAQMKKFVDLSVSDYQKLKGKKMNFLEKASFKLSQKRMKKMLTQYAYGEVSTLQKIGWLLRGLILGPIAVLLAYLFTTEDDRELIKWAWFGFAGWAILLVVILFFAG